MWQWYVKGFHEVERSSLDRPLSHSYTSKQESITRKCCYPLQMGINLSNLICEPSYVSFEDALSRYDLIPEYVPVCSAATYGKRKSIRYKNDLGYYNFTNIPKEAFPYGVEVYEYGGFSWKMATPEKAICDLLYTRNPLKDADDVKGFLIEGMRIEEEDFKDLDKEKMYLLAGFYDHINMKMLREALS